MRVLAGDVGGTKTLLAVFDATARPMRVLREERFESGKFDGLESVVRAFFAKTREDVASACFAIAGPVVDGECITSNLPWHVRSKTLVSELSLRSATLVNDFLAVGHGLDQLAGGDVVELQRGTREERGPVAILGAGTGLGEAFLVWDGRRYAVHASEGGHAAFAPRDAVEAGLLEHLRARFGHVSWERVLSGQGLANIYRYLVEKGVEKASPEVTRAMESEDPAAVISKNALAGSDRACGRALEVFVAIYGGQAANLALTILATGGVYVAGGIAPRIISKMTDGTFIRAFRDKGRLSRFVEAVPVNVIVNTRVGLLGAASCAAREAGG